MYLFRNARYSAKAVANFFIERGNEEQCRNLTNLKIQKLIFIAHGWHLAIMGTPLISEPFEAWLYGPVVPNLYHELKYYGQNQITQLITDFDPLITEEEVLYNLKNRKDVPHIFYSDTDVIKILNKVWEIYKDKDGYYLSALTHKAGTPWHSSRIKNKNGIIDNKQIQEYYEKIFKEINNKTADHG